MNEIFISYASEDRPQAEKLASALRERGWDVWWDREIPLGKSFDEVIENALSQAKCVIVLWSAVSVVSEWVRNEATEGKRRGILAPVFIEHVDAPFAFRLLNGADLTDWIAGGSEAEFQRLVGRVTELLAPGTLNPPGTTAAINSRQPTLVYQKTGEKSWLTPLNLSIFAIAILGAAVAGYVFRGPAREIAPEERPPIPTKTEPAGSTGSSDMEKRIHDLVGSLGGALPATALAKGFHVPDLGLRIAYLTPEQSAATLGAMPVGAVVMEIESGRPMAKAGIHVGDVVLSIAGKKIGSEDDLRQAIFKIGPGKTQYSYRRENETKMVAVDCPGCKVE
ncbi:MAG TPA: TIR domain-containing protein [Candidatus Binatia bacterium]|nr:TIR domain-containing protein [Candidatus Binatia bacterium]